MSTHIVSDAKRHSTARLAARLVLWELADEAGHDGWVVIRVSTIAEEAGLGLSTVREALRWLVDAGEVEVRSGKDTGQASVYRVLLSDRRPVGEPIPDRLLQLGRVARIQRPRRKAPPPEAGDPGSRDPARPGSRSLEGGSPNPGAPPIPVSEEGISGVSPVSCPQELPPCSRARCDRGAGHPGPHRDAWFDAVGEALYPGEGVPEHQKALAGKLARRAEKAGHPPERILQAADWILEHWGADRLTLPGLFQNYERASGELAQNTIEVAARLRAAAHASRRRPAPPHEHEWEPHFRDPHTEICRCGGRRPATSATVGGEEGTAHEPTV